jgi:hypothetical protein
VNELPPKMIPIEYDEANDTPTTLGPFFLHWISLFTVILAFGFSMYHFTVPVFWKICVSTLMSALVLSMGVVVPTFYGSRRVPVPSPGEAADATAFSEKESEQDEEEHLSRKVSHGSYADSQFESQSFLSKKKSSEDEALAAALDVCFYGSSIPLSESIKTWRFWAIYFTFMTLCGTALMVIDDINLIAASLGTSPSTFFATCVSLANGLGRVTAGYMSDLLVTRFSRMQMMSCVAISMGLAQGLFAVGSTTLLYPCLLIVGYLFGCTVALIAVTVPDGICVRNMDSGDILFWMSEACRAPCFIGDGEHAIAVLSSGAVRVLDANNGDEVRSIPQGFSENIVRRPVTSLDGSMCAVLATKEFAVWNTNTWNRSFLKKEYIIDEVSFGESGNLVMVCYSKGVDEPKHHAICWRIADGSIVFDVEMNCNYEFVQHSPHRGTFFLCNSRGNICELDANGSVLSCHKGREGVKSISVIHSIILL